MKAVASCAHRIPCRANWITLEHRREQSSNAPCNRDAHYDETNPSEAFAYAKKTIIESENAAFDADNNWRVKDFASIYGLWRKLQSEIIP